MMKSSSWVIVSAVFFSGFAMAQSGSSVTESTDPAKISAIEQHAQQLTSGGSGMQATGSQGMGQEQGMNHMKHGMKHGMKHHKKHRMMHHKAKAAMQDKAAPDQPMANEAKK